MPHSTSKCNTRGLEDFRRCLEAEAFPQKMIEPAFDRLYLGLRDLSKVGLLREEAPDQANRVLDGASLPAMEGLAEVGAAAEGAVGLDVFGVLREITGTSMKTGDLSSPHSEE